MRFPFRRRIRHPFYPALKPAPAVAATQDSPALYGAFEDLKAAAGAGIRVARAVFPLLTPSRPFLPEPHRDTLWRMFRVPVYTILLDPDGSIVGYECEVQEGLHIRERYIGTLYGRVEHTLCECGRPGPRLMPSASADAVTDDRRLAG